MTDFVDRLERACSRAEYEFPRLAAPDGTVAVSFTYLRQLLASVGRNPEGQDRETGLGRNDEHAVGEAETPNPSPDTGLIEALERHLQNMIALIEANMMPLSKDEYREVVAARTALANAAPAQVESEE